MNYCFHVQPLLGLTGVTEEFDRGGHSVESIYLREASLFLNCPVILIFLLPSTTVASLFWNNTVLAILQCLVTHKGNNFMYVMYFQPYIAI